jgi:hypothetical protein
MYEIRCSSCHLRGMASANRAEVENLTTIHNTVVHNREPVARVHRVQTFTPRFRGADVPFTENVA